MYIILTVKNTPAQRKAAQQAIVDLTDEYGEFSGYRETTSVDSGLIVHILDAPDASLYQEDIQYIAGSAVNVLVVGG